MTTFSKTDFSNGSITLDNNESVGFDFWIHSVVDNIENGQYRTNLTVNQKWIYSHDIETMFSESDYNDLKNGLDVENFKLQKYDLEKLEWLDCDLDGQFI